MIRSFLTNFAADSSSNDDDDDQFCSPNSTWSFNETCAYVTDTDACGGGGWLDWAALVYCCEDPVAKWFIVAGGVLMLVLLFLMLQSSADDFFSPNLGTIVAHLNMSEGVAGVTFLAFGNGAPDIFGAIASVLSSPSPKADLALGGLIGAAIFVTLMVHAAVVITTPFKCSFFSTTRDLLFFLVTATGILCFFVFYDNIQLWQPLTFLGIYVFYLIAVIISEYIKKRRRANKIGEMSKRNSVIPTIQVNGEEEKDEEPWSSVTSFRKSTDVHDHDHHKGSEVHDELDFIVMHNKVYHRDTLASRRESMRSVAEAKGPTAQLLSFFALDYGDDDDEVPSTAGKIKAVIFWPIVTLFKLTIPLAEAPWSKPLAIIHSIIVPQCVLFCTQFITFVPIDGGPGLYAYAPVISIILIAFLLIFTNMNEEPRFYKMTYSLLGFVTSVVWIYCISSGVVGVVNMLGIVSGISQAVLGVTVIAWANSIGDLVADIAVAKQGFPRMAVAASIGGPLFNLLIGFGLPFTIAKLEGDYVPISLDGVNLIMIVFLFISIITTLGTVIIFKANLTRIYGVILVIIYVAFLVFVILAETGILEWM